jgi:hypothetical protein
MAAPLKTCTTIEQRGVVHFFGAKNKETKDIHKEMLPILAAFLCVLCRYLLRGTKDIHGKHLPGLELNPDLL